MPEFQINLIFESELRAPFQSDAKNLIPTTVYGLAWKLDAVADPKELQFRKSSVLPNDRIIQIGYILQIDSEVATEQLLNSILINFYPLNYSAYLQSARLIATYLRPGQTLTTKSNPQFQLLASLMLYTGDTQYPQKIQ